jgi:hypothetical protein
VQLQALQTRSVFGLGTKQELGQRQRQLVLVMPTLPRSSLEAMMRVGLHLLLVRFKVGVKPIGLCLQKTNCARCI